MRHVLMQRVILVLAGLVLWASQTIGNEDLRHLVQGLAEKKTLAELEQQADRIAKRLDHLVTLALEGVKTVDAAKQRLRSLLVVDGPLELGQDVNLWEIPLASRILIIYNLPLGPIGATRKVALRVWRREKEQPTGRKGAIALIEDDGGGFGTVSSYPVHDIYPLMMKDKEYIVLFGEIGHGRGKQALSLWDIDESRCVWVKELAYGEWCNVRVEDGQLAINYDWDRRTEIYGWQNDEFSKLSAHKEER